MKKKLLSLLVALCLIMALAPAALAAGSTFSDISAGAWYADEIDWVKKQDLMDGVGNGTFAPDATTTRAMIWTILARLSGENVDGGTPWYGKAQAWAMANGVSDGTNPEGIITRQELVTMLYRYMGSPDVSDATLAAMSTYPDSNSVSDWAQQSMAWAISNNVISGVDGTLQPQGGATRAQTAVVLYRVNENVVEKEPEKEPEEKPQEKPTQPPASGGGTYVPPHSHGYCYTANGNGTHDGRCICGDTMTGACNDSGENGACSLCGDTKTYVASIDGIKYETLEAAVAAANGGTVTLIADIDLPTAVEVTADMTLDLNGKTLTVSEDTAGDGVFHVTAGTLTINGEGTVDGVGKNDYNMAIWADGGNVVINGGTYTNVNITGSDDHYDLIYAKGGTITINGGRFECKTPKWTLNCKDNNGTIIVTGGTFTGYDPSASSSENPIANFLAPGCKVVLNEDGTCTVTELTAEESAASVNGVYYTDLQEAIDAAKNGTVILVNNWEISDIEKRISITANGILDGDGKKISYSGSRNSADGSVGVVTTTGGEVKNLTIDGGENGRALFVTSLTSDLTVTNCVLDGTYSFNASIGGEAKHSLAFVDTWFKSWVSYGTGVKSVSFDGCDFDYYLRAYCDTTLTDCQFTADFILDADDSVSDIQITLTDCYVSEADGVLVLVTAENIAELLELDANTKEMVVVSNSVGSN